MSGELIDDCHPGESADGCEHARLARLFAIADEAIAAGFDVMPAAVWVKSDGTVGKAPLTVHGHLDAHHERHLIRQQLIDPPHVPNGVPAGFEVVVAVVPGSGGCALLDCDVKSGKAGETSLRALVAEHGQFVTSAWRTPSGGGNVLLRKPPGAVYGNGSPWPGIDVRADGGWVVAPGNSCAGGDWTWLDGTGYTTASVIPPGMAAQLTAPSQSGRRATGAETVAFIQSSPTTSTLPVMHKFRDELAQFRAAKHGSRHDALVHIVSWSFGMHALDLRDAMEQIKAEWQRLTAGEGREDEVDVVACWVAGREIDQRGAQPPPTVEPTTGEIKSGRRRVRLTPASSIRVRPVKWIWLDRVALGTLALIGGREGIGKSILTYQLVADITRGVLPGVNLGTPRAVIVCATEDSWEHTIVPRLMAGGADLDRVFRIDVTTSEDVAGTLSLPHDMALLEEMVTEADAAVVVLDPLLSRLDVNLDTHKDAEVRTALEPLVALADRTGTAVLGLIHVNKGTTTDPLTMLMASRAFAAVARAVLFVTVDPEDPTERRRFLGQPKNNLGTLGLPMLVFEIVSKLVASTPEGPVTTGRLVWQGEDPRSIADVLRAAAGPTSEPTEVIECADWLSDYLTIHDVASSKDVKAAAKLAGHKERTLQRARQRIGAGDSSHGFPRSSWWSRPGMTPDEVTDWFKKQPKP